MLYLNLYALILSKNYLFIIYDVFICIYLLHIFNFPDNDEPLVSGTGDVSKECNEVELESWKDVLLKWATCKSPPARQLAILVKEGIPEALRGEVWFRLAKADLDPKLMDTYRVLITKVFLIKLLFKFKID